MSELKWNKGFFVTPNNLLTNGKLSSNEKVVFMYLHSWDWHTEKELSQRYIAEQLNLSRNTIVKCITTLISEGMIRITKKYNHYENHANSYETSKELSVNFVKKDIDQDETKLKQREFVKQQYSAKKEVDQTMIKGGSNNYPGADHKLTQVGSKKVPILNKEINKIKKESDACGQDDQRRSIDEIYTDLYGKKPKDDTTKIRKNPINLEKHFGMAKKTHLGAKTTVKR